MTEISSESSLEERIESIDLQGLRLIALLSRTESMSQTAATLAISISKASRELAFLRRLFEDDLFVRSGGRMVPTARMRMIEPRIRMVFEALGGLFDPAAHFDPHKATGLVRIAASDNAFTVCLMPFLSEVSARMPGVHIDVMPQTEGTVEALQSGEADLLIAHDPFMRMGENFRHEELLHSSHVVVMRPGHPLSQIHPKDLDEWNSAITPWRLIMSNVRMPSGFDRPNGAAAAVLGQAPVQCPYFISALLHAVMSDKVMVCAEALARELATLMPLEYRVLEGAPEWRPFMCWHERTHHNPLHQWLRSLLITRIREKYAREKTDILSA